jgi:hypothetical protein
MAAPPSAAIPPLFADIRSEGQQDYLTQQK